VREQSTILGMLYQCINVLKERRNKKLLSCNHVLNRSGLRFLSVSAQGDPAVAKSVHDFSATNIDGEEVHLSKYKGQVCVIVNVASK